jgi:hypothetical protein
MWYSGALMPFLPQFSGFFHGFFAGGGVDSAELDGAGTDAVLLGSGAVQSGGVTLSVLS